MKWIRTSGSVEQAHCQSVDLPHGGANSILSQEVTRGRTVEHVHACNVIMMLCIFPDARLSPRWQLACLFVIPSAAGAIGLSEQQYGAHRAEHWEPLDATRPRVARCRHFTVRQPTRHDRQGARRHACHTSSQAKKTNTWQTTIECRACGDCWSWMPHLAGSQ